VKIGPVDPEIICLKLKNKKLRKVKYIARSASLPSGLNEYLSATFLSAESDTSVFSIQSLSLAFF